MPRDVFSRIAGHRALDLVNTVEWRLAPERWSDDLHGYDDVLRWVEQVGLVSATEARTLRGLATDRVVAAAEFERVRDLREAIYATLYEGGEPGILTREYADAVAAGELSADGGRWGWSLPVESALPRRRIALEAYDLLTRADLGLLAQCQDEACGWVFLDTSPRHNRRWCVAADCGNRNRARDFYRRSRTAAS